MPGVLSARWSGRHGDDEANTALLLGQVADVPDERRGAAFVCAAGLVTTEGNEGGIEREGAGGGVRGEGGGEEDGERTAIFSSQDVQTPVRRTPGRGRGHDRSRGGG